ncbi:uncharacterized protein J7T54_004093 [Emericellopsis cladophorae]|uniref:Uncharacterized protein n=1 Tax=Emericellopsis cladophorae TaxID=2686198 RepID=A0A9P9Y1D6_9HYPO|nr:uncharacterized protein J7T54_004093 [Emericellopsis cladophorae]KAI6781320.1 hypothetical protein J7T54_004093 [Emericellopsis cladophorae]
MGFLDDYSDSDGLAPPPPNIPSRFPRQKVTRETDVQVLGRARGSEKITPTAESQNPRSKQYGPVKNPKAAAPAGQFSAGSHDPNVYWLYGFQGKVKFNIKKDNDFNNAVRRLLSADPNESEPEYFLMRIDTRFGRGNAAKGIVKRQLPPLEWPGNPFAGFHEEDFRTFLEGNDLPPEYAGRNKVWPFVCRRRTEQYTAFTADAACPSGKGVWNFLNSRRQAPEPAEHELLHNITSLGSKSGVAYLAAPKAAFAPFHDIDMNLYRPYWHEALKVIEDFNSEATATDVNLLCMYFMDEYGKLSTFGRHGLISSLNVPSPSDLSLFRRYLRDKAPPNDSTDPSLRMVCTGSQGLVVLPGLYPAPQEGEARLPLRSTFGTRSKTEQLLEVAKRIASTTDVLESTFGHVGEEDGAYIDFLLLPPQACTDPEWLKTESMGYSREIFSTQVIISAAGLLQDQTEWWLRVEDIVKKAEDARGPLILYPFWPTNQQGRILARYDFGNMPDPSVTMSWPVGECYHVELPWLGHSISNLWKLAGGVYSGLEGYSLKISCRILNPAEEGWLEAGVAPLAYYIHPATTEEEWFNVRLRLPKRTAVMTRVPTDEAMAYSLPEKSTVWGPRYGRQLTCLVRARHTAASTDVASWQERAFSTLETAEDSKYIREALEVLWSVPDMVATAKAREAGMPRRPHRPLYTFRRVKPEEAPITPRKSERFVAPKDTWLHLADIGDGCTEYIGRGYWCVLDDAKEEWLFLPWAHFPQEWPNRFELSLSECQYHGTGRDPIFKPGQFRADNRLLEQSVSTRLAEDVVVQQTCLNENQKEISRFPVHHSVTPSPDNLRTSNVADESSLPQGKRVLRKRGRAGDRNYHPSHSDSSLNGDEADEDEDGDSVIVSPPYPEDGSTPPQRKRKRKIDDPNYRPAAAHDDEEVAAVGEPTVTVVESYNAAPTGKQRARSSKGAEEPLPLPDYESEAEEEEPVTKKQRRKSTTKKADQQQDNRVVGARKPKMASKAKATPKASPRKATAQAVRTPKDEPDDDSMPANGPPQVTEKPSTRTTKAAPKKAAAKKTTPRKTTGLKAAT